jgi:dihydrofolate reductase
MRKVVIFNMVSVDGFFAGPDGDINWHSVDDEFNEFAIEQLDTVDTLLFGRVTYELMASYWPTPQAIEDDPSIADKMNNLKKIVFSKTLASVDWQNTLLIKGNVADKLSDLKGQPGKDLILFGSADLASTLTQYGLIDEYRIMVSPVVLGEGLPLFKGITQPLRLKLIEARTFHSGNVLLVYQPATR